MFSPAAELIISVPPPQAEDINRGYNFDGQKSPHLDCCIKGSHLLDLIICIFFFFATCRHYTQLGGGRIPVCALTFQEPESDLQNCCYLWAVQSTQQR